MASRLRLLLIAETASASPGGRERIAKALPDVQLMARSLERDGTPPPELRGLGLDAVLIDASLAGRGLACAQELSARPGFAPVMLLAERIEPELARAARAADLHLLTYSELDAARCTALLQAAGEQQARVRADWRSGSAGLAEQRFGGVFVRGYRHIRRLAAGRSTDLYLAESEAAGELVALKLARDRQGDAAELDDSFGRFLKEHEIVQRVQGPSVVRLHELGVSDEHAWLVMEYFPCGDLRARMRRGVAARAALELALRIARALQSIHAAGVIHRDLKPGNVMLRTDGSVALIDFGFAQDASRDLAATDPGAIFGTPHYMSPEQGHGEPLDPRSDLYSLGVMLFEMLTGGKPYRADNPMAIIYKHRKEPVPQLPEPHAALQALIGKLLAKTPEERFADAHQAAAALDESCARLSAEH